MPTTIRPLIYKCQETPGFLSTLKENIIAFAGDDAELLLDYPVVYLHVWENKDDSLNGKHHVYVGEADNVIRRQGEHWAAAVDPKHPKNWQHEMANAKDSFGNRAVPTLYIIGHPLFQKSLTLDIEDRLINYCLAMETAITKNGRFNPQGKYKGDDSTDSIFGFIWRELRKDNPNFFLPESAIQKSAIYKASPNHKLKEDQKLAKSKIIERTFDAIINGKDHQLIMVEGEAGTGKTVLASSTFYDLQQKISSEGDIDETELKAYLLVNHEEQLGVYASMARQMGYGDIVLKPTTFIANFSPTNPVDIVFVDEAHLLWTQKKQAYNMGNNQLRDIMDRARVTVIMFDEYQVLRKEQFIEPNFIHEIRTLSQSQGNHIPMINQLRMNCDKNTMAWIDAITKNQVIPNLSKDTKGYEVRIFDTPDELHTAIKQKAQHDSLSRLIAGYDWPYNSKKRPDAPQKYWEVQIPPENPTWSLPWNRELLEHDPTYTNLPARSRMRLKALDWAEQEQTINEVGSTFTIQGFDLSYAGVIIGPSVTYDSISKVIRININGKWYDKMKGMRTMSDGTPRDVGDVLIKNELRVLLTRGTKGLYIYACDDALRKALKDAIV